MSDTTAEPVETPAEEPKPERKFRVEALCVGEAGALKLMVIRTGEPNKDQREKYRSRVTAQYMQEFGNWCENAPTVTVVPQ